MLAQQNLPAAHAGEDRSSPDLFAPRTVHWANTLVGLLGAAKTVANTYLQQERADPAACIDADHHRAIVDLFAAIGQADALGLSLTGALQLVEGSAVPAQLWFAKGDRFSAPSVRSLIEANSWLRPGDVVYKAQTIVRHQLTEKDFETADLAAIGGEA